MRKSLEMLGLALVVLLSGCARSAPEATQPIQEAAKPRGAYRIYVSNETSGDLTIIDSANFEIVGTVALAV